MKCFECNSEMKHVNDPYKYEESGLPNLYLVNFAHYRCPKCNDEVIEIPRIWLLHLTIGLTLINKPTPLNGREISFLRREMDMSSVEFAEKLGVSHYTISKWENNKKKPRSVSDKAIRLLFWNNMQRMLADRLEGIEETIERQKISSIENRRIEVDMPKLDSIPLPHMLAKLGKTQPQCLR